MTVSCSLTGMLIEKGKGRSGWLLHVQSALAHTPHCTQTQSRTEGCGPAAIMCHACRQLRAFGGCNLACLLQQQEQEQQQQQQQEYRSHGVLPWCGSVSGSGWAGTSKSFKKNAGVWFQNPHGSAQAESVFPPALHPFIAARICHRHSFSQTQQRRVGCLRLKIAPRWRAVRSSPQVLTAGRPTASPRSALCRAAPSAASPHGKCVRAPLHFYMVASFVF